MEIDLYFPINVHKTKQWPKDLYMRIANLRKINANVCSIE